MKKILILDSNIFSAEAEKEELESTGLYFVKVALSVRDALTYNKKFDLIIFSSETENERGSLPFSEIEKIHKGKKIYQTFYISKYGGYSKGEINLLRVVKKVLEQSD